MDLEIYNKAKICKYLEFYKKNLSKEEYKKVLKQFKLSLKLGNASLAKTLLQRRGFIFVDSVRVDSNVDYKSDNETYTVYFYPADKSIIFYNVTRSHQHKGCENNDGFNNILACTSGGGLLDLTVCTVSPTITVTVTDKKISGISSNIKVSSYVYMCCRDAFGSRYYGDCTEKTGGINEDFFAVIYTGDIISGECRRLFNSLCRDGGINCTGCGDCVYFLARNNLKFPENGDQCKGYAEENDYTGAISYDSSNNTLKVTFPVMEVWAGSYSTFFQYETTSVEVKV